MYYDLNANDEQAQSNSHRIKIIQFKLISSMQSIEDLAPDINDARFISPLNNFTYSDEKFKEFYGIMIGLNQMSYNIVILLSNTTFESLKEYEILSVYIASCKPAVNIIFVIGCKFKNNAADYLATALINIQILFCNNSPDNGRSKNIFFRIAHF